MAVTALWVLCFAPPAEAFVGPWAFPAVELAAPAAGASTGATSVDVADDGTVVATWLRDPDAGPRTVEASIRRPGGAFVPGVPISGPDASVPDLAIAADGTAVVTWSRFDGVDNQVEAAIRPAGGEFRPPVVLSPRGVEASEPRVDVAPDGAAVVAWKQQQGDTHVAHASVRTAGGDFSIPIPLGTPGRDATEIRVATGDQGAATVVWLEGALGEQTVNAATRTADGHFKDPVKLTRDGASGSTPDVAAARDGSATLVFTEREEFAVAARIAVREQDGSLSAPASLSAQGRAPRVASAANGAAVLVWATDEGLSSRVKPPRGAFGPVLPLGRPGENAGDYEAAVGPDGSAVATWVRADAGTFTVRAAVLPAGGVFGPATRLSAGSGGDPSVAIGTDGFVVAAWDRREPTGHDTAVALPTANPPTIAAPTVIGSGDLGAELACVSGASTGTARIEITWQRDGAIVSHDARYTVTTADQGHAITCRTTAFNPYGVAEATSAPVPVGPAPSPAGTAGLPSSPQAASITSRRPLAPTALSLPRLTGTPRVGRTLHCKAARFTGATKRTRHWIRGRTTIHRHTKVRYRVTARDLGRVITCRTTATGTGGTSSVVSLGVLIRR